MSNYRIDVVQVAPRLTASNDAPTRVEAASVRDAIAKEETLIANLKDEVKAAKVRIREYQAVLAPCRRLPPDILGEIFFHIPPGESQSDGEFATYQDTVKTLVCVCRKWKEAAIAVPRLWSSLEIVIKKRKRPLALEGLGAWLGRAGSVPRDLVIYSSSCEVRRSVEGEGWRRREREYRACFNGNTLCVLAKPELAEALSKMNGRCNSIKLKCSAPACAQNFERLFSSFERSNLQPTQSAWSSTKTFSLVGYNWEEWPASSRFLTHLIPASVTSLGVHLSDMFYGFTRAQDESTKLQLPPERLEGLTSLELTSNLAGRHLFPMLQGCRNLETLVVDFCSECFHNDCEDPAVQQIVQAGIVLPKLRTLEVRGAVTTDGLECLRMPALVELALEYDEEAYGEIYHADNNEGSFATLVRGHSPLNSTLRSFRLVGGTYGKNVLYEALSRLTALKHLTLDDATYPMDTFSRLSEPVPRLMELRRLKLLNLYQSVERVQQLVEFVEDRDVELETSCNDEYWQEE